MFLSLPSLLFGLLISVSAYATPLNQLLDNNADQTSPLSTKTLSSPPGSAEESEEFLPVEQAYQLSLSINDNELLAEWLIADKYFLYGEQFRFTANDKPLTATGTKGIIKYDPIFEKNVEKHYQFTRLSISKGQLPTNSPYELTITSQGCADAGLCYPPQTQRFIVEGSNISPVSDNEVTPINRLASPTPIQTVTLFSVFAFALLGGMILNLMPCVLPVLSLKALSLAKSEGNHRHQGWSYTLGVVSTFVAVAAALLAVRAAGQAVGWGFQLQSPGFITLLLYLFFVMGLSLSGYITLGTRWMNLGQGLTEGKGLKQSYFTGVLAAVVASPCTAPFMASALGYAITQPWWIALCIFAALGLGMALPLLLLSYLPQLERWLPKPGAWMDTFKQALAFPLYLTAIWLLWVLGRQLGVNTSILAIIGALLMVFLFWLGNINRRLAGTFNIMVLIVAAAMAWHNSQQARIEQQESLSSLEWEPYSEQRLEELRNKGQAVFINMTADWCITCLANERLVFTESTLKKMKDDGIILIKGDWTNYAPPITRLLERYQRGGVPLYLFFPAKPNADAIILPQLLTPSVLQQALNNPD